MPSAFMSFRTDVVSIGVAAKRVPPMYSVRDRLSKIVVTHRSCLKHLTA